MNEDTPHHIKRDAQYYANLVGYKDVPESGTTIFNDIEGPVESESVVLSEELEILDPDDQPVEQTAGSAVQDLGYYLAPHSPKNPSPFPIFVRDNLCTLILLSFFGPVGWFCAGAFVLYQVQDRWL